MAALLADKPDRPLQHRSEIIIHDAVRAENDLSHFEPFAVFARFFLVIVGDPVVFRSIRAASERKQQQAAR
jgi:hypothetical protein